ncbi:hypothetical protein ABPG72_018435 [Tetrahymena utriculariae]
MDSTIEQIKIYEKQKELFKLKMIVRMSFTVEQYAALQLCGLRILQDENIPNIEDSFQENRIMKEDLFKSSAQENIKEIKKQSVEIELKLKENEIEVKQKEEQLNQNEQLTFQQQKQNQDNYLAQNMDTEKQNIQLDENYLSKPQEKQNTKTEFEDNIFKLDEKNDKKFKKLNFKTRLKDT